MNIIELLGNNWLLILILGLTGMKILLLLNKRYMDKKIDESDMTEKEMNQTFGIIGTIMTAMFALVGYYFWNTYQK